MSSAGNCTCNVTKHLRTYTHQATSEEAEDYLHALHASLITKWKAAHDFGDDVSAQAIEVELSAIDRALDALRRDRH